MKTARHVKGIFEIRFGVRSQAVGRWGFRNESRYSGWKLANLDWAAVKSEIWVGVTMTYAAFWARRVAEGGIFGVWVRNLGVVGVRTVMGEVWLEELHDQKLL